MDDFQYFSIKLHVGNHLNNCKALMGVYTVENMFERVVNSVLSALV